MWRFVGALVIAFTSFAWDTTSDSDREAPWNKRSAIFRIH